MIIQKLTEPEGKMKFFHTGVEFILLCVFLYWSKMSQNSHKVLEVNFLLLMTPTLEEESVDYPVTKWIDGQLGDPEEVLSTEVTFVLFVQAGEPTMFMF